jgi:hypothetical protein
MPFEPVKSAGVHEDDNSSSDNNNNDDDYEEAEAEDLGRDADF